MLRKYFFVPALLSLALTLVAVDAAQAQIRINRGGISIGGGNGGYGGYGGNRGYYGPGYYGGGNYGRGYYGNNYYGGNYYGRGYYGNNYYNAWPYWSNPSPIYVEPSTSYYSTPAEDNAHVRVLLPDANARVWFNGSLTSQTGNDRLFHTPPLSFGSSNNYTVRAQWTQNGQQMDQERMISVTPGTTSVVDFTRR